MKSNHEDIFGLPIDQREDRRPACDGGDCRCGLCTGCCLDDEEFDDLANDLGCHDE